MSNLQKQRGDHGQNLAVSILSQMGVNMVEKIGTPVKLIPVKSFGGEMVRRKDVFIVVWGEKVSGDHRGLLSNGVSVLAETKTILDRNLRYGDLREHQPAKLTEHAESNGLSLLVWVHASGVYVMRWPIEGFGPGKGIDQEQAQREHKRAAHYIKAISSYSWLDYAVDLGVAVREDWDTSPT